MIPLGGCKHPLFGDVWGLDHTFARALFLSQWFHHESTNDEYCDVNNATMNPGSPRKISSPPGRPSLECFGFLHQASVSGGIRQNVIQDQGDETDHILLFGT